MEPELATTLIEKHMEMSKRVQLHSEDIDDKSLTVCVVILLASLARQTEMEPYDLLQLVDVALQVLDVPEGLVS